MKKCQCDCDCKTKSYEYCEHCHHPLTSFVPDDQPKGTLKDLLTPNPSEWETLDKELGDTLEEMLAIIPHSNAHQTDIRWCLNCRLHSDIKSLVHKYMASSQMRAEEKWRQKLEDMLDDGRSLGDVIKEALSDLLEDK